MGVKLTGSGYLGGRPDLGEHARMTAVWQPRLDVDEYWSWQLSGKCLDHPADLFFPENAPRADRRGLEEQAKRICRVRPVLLRCRELAVSVPERYGVWGAMTPRERGVPPSRRPAKSGGEMNSR